MGLYPVPGSDSLLGDFRAFRRSRARACSRFALPYNPSSNLRPSVFVGPARSSALRSHRFSVRPRQASPAPPSPRCSPFVAGTEVLFGSVRGSLLPSAFRWPCRSFVPVCDWTRRPLAMRGAVFAHVRPPCCLSGSSCVPRIRSVLAVRPMCSSQCNSSRQLCSTTPQFLLIPSVHWLFASVSSFLCISFLGFGVFSLYYIDVVPGPSNTDFGTPLTSHFRLRSLLARLVRSPPLIVADSPKSPIVPALRSSPGPRALVPSRSSPRAPYPFAPSSSSLGEASLRFASAPTAGHPHIHPSLHCTFTSPSGLLVVSSTRRLPPS